jgi:glucose/arabinose dehydrogenase
VVESGYSYGKVKGRPRVVELSRGPGRARVLREIAAGGNAPWNGITFHDGALFVAQGGHEEGGRIVRVDLDGKTTVLVDGLPSMGDHHTNGPAVGRDGWIYFGQGTATNSAVVGEDSHKFGWLAKHQEVHDIPCQDVTLTGRNYTSGNPLTPDEKDEATTGAYQQFGTPSRPGQVVRGQVPCNGAVMRVQPTGGPVELVAWGFRNPFGLAVAPDGQIYVTDNGYDVRGSRPVFGSADVLWRLQPGAWYGWPDYSEGRPIDLPFYSEEKGDPKGMALARHPGKPPAPVAYFAVHSSADGFDFSKSAAFGHAGDAFVAIFGDMSPTVGKVVEPVGFSVVRVDPRTGVIEDFARNRGDKSGPASRLGSGGLERPLAVRFDPSGAALYVVDFGVLRMSEAGEDPTPKTGVVWRITREGSHAR